MLIDSHAHVNLSAFDRDREQVFARARQGGVRAIINIGMDVKSSRASLKLAKKYDDVFSTVGFHPHEASELKDEDLETLAELAKDDKVVAVGEIGLDFYRNLSPRPSQIEAFRKQLDLAIELSLPEVVHCRQAHRETFNILSDYLAKKNLPNAVVVSADLGFAKKGRNFAEKLSLPLAFVEKRRSLTDASSKALTLIGDVRDRDVFIVDDEVDTAGSLVEAATIVKDRGARDIYASFTHPIFSPPAVERLQECGIKEMVTTNTIPIPPEKMLPNITILSVAPLLGEVIRRVHLGISVGEYMKDVPG